MIYLFLLVIHCCILVEFKSLLLTFALAACVITKIDLPPVGWPKWWAIDPATRDDIFLMDIFYSLRNSAAKYETRIESFALFLQ